MPLIIKSPNVKANGVTVSDAGSTDSTSYDDLDTDEELYDDLAPSESQKSDPDELSTTRPRPHHHHATRIFAATKKPPSITRSSPRGESHGNTSTRRHSNPAPAPPNNVNYSYRPNQAVPPHGNHVVPYLNNVNMPPPPVPHMQNGYATQPQNYYYGSQYPAPNPGQPQQPQQPHNAYAHMPFAMGPDGMYAMYNATDPRSTQPIPPPPNRGYPAQPDAPYQGPSNALYHQGYQPPAPPFVPLNAPTNVSTNHSDAMQMSHVSPPKRSQEDADVVAELAARLTKMEAEAKTRKKSEESLRQEVAKYKVWTLRSQEEITREIARARREAAAAVERRQEVERQWTEELDRHLERERSLMKVELTRRFEAEQEARKEAREAEKEAKEAIEEARELEQLEREARDKEINETLRLHLEHQTKRATEAEQERAWLTAEIRSLQAEMQGIQTTIQATQATQMEEAKEDEMAAENPPSPTPLDIRPNRPHRKSVSHSWNETPPPEVPDPPPAGEHVAEDSEGSEDDNVSVISEVDDAEERRILKLLRDEIVRPIVSAVSDLAKGPIAGGMQYQAPMFAPYPPVPQYARGSSRYGTPSSYTETESEDSSSIASRQYRRRSRWDERERPSQSRVVVPELSPEDKAKSSALGAQIEERAVNEEDPALPVTPAETVVNRREPAKLVEATAPAIKGTPEGDSPSADDDEFTWVNSDATEQPPVNKPALIKDQELEKPRRNPQDMNHSRNTGRYFMADFRDHMAMPEVYRRGRVEVHGKSARRGHGRLQVPVVPHAFYPMPYFQPTFAEMQPSRSRRQRGGDEDVD